MLVEVPLVTVDSMFDQSFIKFNPLSIITMFHRIAFIKEDLIVSIVNHALKPYYQINMNVKANGSGRKADGGGRKPLKWNLLFLIM